MQMTQKIKGALSGTFNTLSGKNGASAAIEGWCAVINVAAAFIPPVASAASVFNLAVGGICAGLSHMYAKDHLQNAFTF